MANLAANWSDLLAKDFRKIYFDQYTQLPVMVPDLFNVMNSDAAYEKTSGAGTVPDFTEFTGKVGEVKPTQMYDKTYVFTEYAAKIEIQRKLAAKTIVGHFKSDELLETLKGNQQPSWVKSQKVQRLPGDNTLSLITGLSVRLSILKDDIVRHLLKNKITEMDDLLKLVVNKFDYLRELSKALFTYKVKIKEILQWIIRRKELMKMELTWVG